MQKCTSAALASFDDNGVASLLAKFTDGTPQCLYTDAFGNLKVTAQDGISPLASLSVVSLGTSATYASTGIDTSNGKVFIIRVRSVATFPATLVAYDCDDTARTGQRIIGSVPVPQDGEVREYTFASMKGFIAFSLVNGTGAQSALEIGYVQTKSVFVDECATALMVLPSGNLGASTSFTSQTFDFGILGKYKKFFAYAQANQASTGFKIQQSPDGTNWYDAQSTTPASGAFSTLTADLIHRYARVVFSNGIVAQTAFYLAAGYSK